MLQWLSRVKRFRSLKASTLGEMQVSGRVPNMPKVLGSFNMEETKHLVEKTMKQTTK